MYRAQIARGKRSRRRQLAAVVVGLVGVDVDVDVATLVVLDGATVDVLTIGDDDVLGTVEVVGGGGTESIATMLAP